MLGTENSGFVCSERDEIVMKLRRGEISREHAEAWARDNNQPPFIKQPDIDRFDPMDEPYWTTAMAVAWIIWGTVDAVRQHWDKYRSKCTKWVLRGLLFPGDQNGPEGRIETGWHIEALDPISVHDILHKAARTDPNNEASRALDAADRFRKELSAGRIVATGKPSKYHPRNLPPMRIDIPKIEWIDLSFYAEPIDRADSIGTVDELPLYHEVLVEREQVLNLWPKGEIGTRKLQVSLVPQRLHDAAERPDSFPERTLPALQMRIVETVKIIWPDGQYPAFVQDRDKNFRRIQETR